MSDPAFTESAGPDTIRRQPAVSGPGFTPMSPRPAAAELRAVVLDTVAKLPHLPGVYRYFDADDNVLYVGKARDLKKRVSSYFQKTLTGPRIAMMVERIARLETTVTRTEAEALLLENNLIKALAAALQHSVSRRQVVSLSEDHRPGRFPRMAYYRGAVDKQAISTSARFQVRGRCTESSRSCRRCSSCAPARTPCSPTARGLACCIRSTAAAPRASSAISEEDYARDVENAARFCAAARAKCWRNWSRRCMRFAARTQVRTGGGGAQPDERLVHACCISRAWRSAAMRDIDILAVVVQGGRACVNLAMVRGGRHLGDSAYFPAHVDDSRRQRTDESIDVRSAESIHGAALHR